MFACLYLPPPANSAAGRVRRPGLAPQDPAPPRKPGLVLQDPATTLALAALVQLARDFSPRVERHGDRTVTLDISGLGRLIGEPRTIGEELRRSAADAGLHVHLAIAATSTAAILLAHARAGLTVVPPGGEAAAVGPLPLDLLDRVSKPLAPTSAPNGATVGKPIAPVLRRWGLRTLGDLAALPSAELSTRLGQDGLRWQGWARGEEMGPLVPTAPMERFEESLDLEWPIDELEPLSFVFARLFDPLCERLERCDRGAVVLRVTLTLVTRQRHERTVELPAPMRDARVLRTLALLDLESHPPPGAVDRVAVAVDVAEGRVLQFGLFARALPSDKLSTLLARLSALVGSDRVGAPSLVDTYRPGAFAMAKFEPSTKGDGSRFRPERTKTTPVPFCLRRYRLPIPARVTLEQGRPVHVATDRRGLSGGGVTRCAGPWRSSGDWWKHGWNCDEWDVAFADGAVYRISQAHDQQTWFVEGVVD